MHQWRHRSLASRQRLVGLGAFYFVAYLVAAVAIVAH